MLRTVLGGGVAALAALAYASAVAGPLLGHRVKAVAFLSILLATGVGALVAVLRG